MRNLLERKKEQKGFTLIEIVLVLAIAGLIMLIVFLAVSGAQKARRDTQRKEDVGRMGALLESYASNTQGDYPNTAALWGTFWTTYVATSNMKDPSLGAYTQGSFVGSTTVAAPALGTVNIGVAGRTYNICVGTEQGADTCVTNQ